MSEIAKKIKGFMDKLSNWSEQLYNPSFLRSKKTDSKLKRLAKLTGKVAVSAVWFTALFTNPIPTIVAVTAVAGVQVLPEIAKAQAARAMSTEKVKDTKPSQTSQRPLRDPELEKILRGLAEKPKTSSSNLSKVERIGWGIDKSQDR